MSFASAQHEMPAFDDGNNMRGPLSLSSNGSLVQRLATLGDASSISDMDISDADCEATLSSFPHTASVTSQCHVQAQAPPLPLHQHLQHVQSLPHTLPTGYQYFCEQHTSDAIVSTCRSIVCELAASADTLIKEGHSIDLALKAYSTALRLVHLQTRVYEELDAAASAAAGSDGAARHSGFLGSCDIFAQLASYCEATASLLGSVHSARLAYWRGETTHANNVSRWQQPKLVVLDLADVAPPNCKNMSSCSDFGARNDSGAASTSSTAAQETVHGVSAANDQSWTSTAPAILLYNMSVAYQIMSSPGSALQSFQLAYESVSFIHDQHRANLLRRNILQRVDDILAAIPSESGASVAGPSSQGYIALQQIREELLRTEICLLTEFPSAASSA